MDNWTLRHDTSDQSDRVIVTCSPDCVVNVKVKDGHIDITFWKDFQDRALVLAFDTNAYNKIVEAINRYAKANKE